jgi:hypothetical protein
MEKIEVLKQERENILLEILKLVHIIYSYNLPFKTQLIVGFFIFLWFSCPL